MPQYFGQLPGLDPAWNQIGAVDSTQRHGRGMICDSGSSRLMISVLAENLIRVRFSPTGEFKPQRSWSVVSDDSDWMIPSFEVQETDTIIELKTSQIHLCLQRDRIRLLCFDSSGRPFARDADPCITWKTGSIALWKRIETDEHFYGFGERTGLLDKLSEIKTNWTQDAIDYGPLTDPMYAAIPFFMALRPDVSYGIFLNTSFWSQFDLGATQPGLLRMETQDSELDYYIIYGPEPSQVLATYTQLTGRMPLPPQWALGYHQCRWSYDSEDVVRELAQEFRERQLPCDVIHLDIDYMRGYRVFTWSPKRFPNPGELIHDLKEQGFQVVTIVDPGVKYEPEADYEVFEAGLQQDYFIRNAQGKLFHGYVWPDKAVFPDFLRSDVRQWWGDCHQALTELGVAGIWNDMNEPAIDDRPFGDPGEKIWFPMDAPQGDETELTTHREVHNLYGQSMAQAAREGLNRLRPNERSFVLTRSGFAGLQKWSALWTGDNQSLWEYLEISLPMLCNLGLSGVAFVGADIGGFAGNATAELFARWMQAGMLYPLMRAHSALSTARHEPWVFGERVEEICRTYLNLRYQLLPYLYTLFWEAATTGAPILRPLLYHFASDPQTYQLHDQVMLGPSLMAAPVYRPGVVYRAVYLPDGTWYDWWTGKRYEGGQHILAEAPLEKMPLFGRSGGVIPLQRVMQFVDEFPVEELTLRVFPGTGEWTLYEDDGSSFEYQQGRFATTTYRLSFENEILVLEVGERQGYFTPPRRTVIVQVAGMGEQSFVDDGATRRLEFH